MTMGRALAACGEPLTKRETAEAVFWKIDQRTSLEERLSVDKTNILEPFTLMSQRKNLPGAHTFQGWNPWL